MANTINIGNQTSLIIKIPARGETNWSQEFKQYFADEIADHDHTTGSGARIKNAALVTYTMVNEGAVFEDVDGNEIAYVETDVTVSTDTIQNSAVTTVKIADDAVTGDKIAANSITTDHIAPDTVIAADIATNAITEDELRDDASDDSLRAVGTNHIKDGAVTLDKLSNTVLITEDTTITADTYNTHFILNDATGSVTLTFSDCKVEGCQFTSSAAIAGYVVLDGVVDFFRNTLHETHLNLTDIDLSDFNISYNSMIGGSIVGNPNIQSQLTQDQTNASSFFRYNFLNVYSINVRMPLGYFAGNTITAKNTSTLYLFAEDDINSYFYNTYQVSGNIITFVGSGNFKKTSSVDNISKSAFQLIYTGTTLTQTALHPSLSDIQDVSSTAPTTGQYLVWDGSEWAPGAVRHISVDTTITSSVADTKFILSNGAELIFSPTLNSHEIVNCEFISTDSTCKIDQANILKRCTFNFAGILKYDAYNPKNIEYNTGIIGGFEGQPDDANGDGFGSTQVGPCIFKGNVLDIKGSGSASICFGTMSENNLTFSGTHNIDTSTESSISGDTDITSLADSNFIRFLQNCNLDLGYNKYNSGSKLIPAGSIFSNGEWLFEGVKPRIDIFSMSISEFTLDSNQQWYTRGALLSEKTGLGSTDRLREGRYKISYDITATTSNPGNDVFSILSGRNGSPSVDATLHDMSPDSSTANTDRWVSEGQIFTIAPTYYHTIEIKHFSDSAGINPTAISGYIIIEKL